ncbi:hypothetical protein P691DRAFT_785431 [Macrolepiota fuliginosa MF-IS2]|uniref:Uncharacterized protein n=1 Tax=Macrolepiota fuliginosa MF-IS2 TaxID=1400762 RepID=A0A9P5X669_9AGAR|nr:hypothetical protein P691DRAFT_785431 [Macrolepiota fuliginosa MF-IS2]
MHHRHAKGSGEVTLATRIQGPVDESERKMGERGREKKKQCRREKLSGKLQMGSEYLEWIIFPERYRNYERRWSASVSPIFSDISVPLVYGDIGVQYHPAKRLDHWQIISTTEACGPVIYASASSSALFLPGVYLHWLWNFGTFSRPRTFARCPPISACVTIGAKVFETLGTLIIVIDASQNAKIQWTGKSAT